MLFLAYLGRIPKLAFGLDLGGLSSCQSLVDHSLVRFDCRALDRKSLGLELVIQWNFWESRGYHGSKFAIPIGAIQFRRLSSPTLTFSTHHKSFTAVVVFIHLDYGLTFSLIHSEMSKPTEVEVVEAIVQLPLVVFMDVISWAYFSMVRLLLYASYCSLKTFITWLG